MKTHVLILIALLVIPLYCATSCVREFVAVDSALDSGASYDYAAGKSDRQDNHPFIAFSDRHRTLLVSSAVLLAVAVVYTTVVVSARVRSRAI